ncbi:DUF202 domain-containing protein [Myxococcota bacterium]|nr:DUF202 domain-containing protein [Myxococcota bacterium]MBU1431463.1 DUF202 domain-containing protein [Myxococcota bacterium]MBU1898545.1 DUF202 domain-containing protein [Myxococcota bacterium]
MQIRDQLASDRTALANLRTLLAFLRTALMLFATSVTLLKLFGDDPTLRLTGWILLPMTLVVLLFGVIAFLRFKRRIAEVNASERGAGAG